jgi:hypothetical protein
MESGMPQTLDAAIATEPVWLQAWVITLVLTHLIAVVFVVTREQGAWRMRPEPIAIVVSFILSGMFMSWLYGVVGYVRLLGLAHLVFWTPAFVWVFLRRRAVGTQSVFGKYLLAYLVIVGISLIIDVVDVVRYLMGDGELLNRWA